jgi:hypothetical protein
MAAIYWWNTVALRTIVYTLWPAVNGPYTLYGCFTLWPSVHGPHTLWPGVHWSYTLWPAVHWPYTLYGRYILAAHTVAGCTVAVHTV